MAEEMEFDSFNNIDDLDWSELEKDIKDTTVEAPAPPAPAAGGAPVAEGFNAAQVAPGTENIDINYLLDVNLQVTVEVGRRQYFIHQVLGWDYGSVIELDKVVGESVDFLINNKPVARGEVVVVNDKFALKVTEIMDPQDRINQLKV